MFAVAFRELLNVMMIGPWCGSGNSCQGRIAADYLRRAYLMELIGAGNAEHELHRSRAHHAQGKSPDALDAAVRTGRTSAVV